MENVQERPPGYICHNTLHILTGIDRCRGNGSCRNEKREAAAFQGHQESQLCRVHLQYNSRREFLLLGTIESCGHKIVHIKPSPAHCTLGLYHVLFGISVRT